ncbi:hypothetical protein [Lyngbya sp. CCY1209]|uniref:hypothetical protein n=1 Tax=Lyngbya sp. CCY1209 TaxID=2886103 RepID=UPI002D215AB3|nr:hypothetical protein [Lyngbya sp. CCY1209]MEB3887137.1 hypothetical protein [Lyngbya sp. CCY1209]
MALAISTWHDRDNRPFLPSPDSSPVKWSGAGQLELPGGYLLVKNDAEFLYIGLDMVGDRHQTLNSGDYFWFSVDVDRNAQITPYCDVNYGFYPDRPNPLGRQFYLEPAQWTGRINERSPSRLNLRFDRSPNSNEPHRIWELSLSLSELGVALDSDEPPQIRCGLRVASENPPVTWDDPPNFYRDFRHLHTLILARHPKTHYPSNTAGAAIAGVGLIPATDINGDGYATTSPTATVPVTDSAFGGRLHLIGNRDTLEDVWCRGARRYRMLHRPDPLSPFAPIFQGWVNYYWEGERLIPEYVGPDGDGYYPLPDPDRSYSMNDLLLRWSSLGYPPGLHQFQVKFYRPDSAIVSAPPQILTLRIDNNRPRVEISQIWREGTPVASDGTVQLTDNRDGLQLEITAWSREGHLADYTLWADYGEISRRRIGGDAYENHRNPTRQWTGIHHQILPSEEDQWFPPGTGAYRLRLEAHSRITNGYSFVGAASVTRNLTPIAPVRLHSLKPQFSPQFPLGSDGLADSGRDRPLRDESGAPSRFS